MGRGGTALSSGDSAESKLRDDAPWVFAVYSKQGRNEEALQEAELALRLDPLAPPVAIRSGMVWHYMSDDVRAVMEIRILTDQWPDVELARFQLAVVLVEQRDASDPRRQTAPVAAVAVTAPLRGPLSALGSNVLGHLRLKGSRSGCRAFVCRKRRPLLEGQAIEHVKS